MNGRAAVWAASLAMLVAGCDPGSSSPVERTPADRYDAWVAEFADERDVWSTSWFGFVEEMQANDGAFSRDSRLTWAQRLGEAAEVLDNAVQQAGEPPAPPAGPTYVHAVHVSLDEVVSASGRSVSCQDEACVEPFVRLIRASRIVQTLIIDARSSAVLVSAPAVRDVPLPEALLTAAEVGAEPYDRTVDPVGVACTPGFEGDLEPGVELPEPTESQEMGALLEPGRPIYESLYRFDTRAIGATYFQIVAVRAQMCELEPDVTTDAGVRLSWSSAEAPTLGTPTLGWRVSLELPGDDSTYELLVLGALVDDTVAYVALGSDAGEPGMDEAEQLLRTGLGALGVSDDELSPP